jgi:ABC-type branched-subunit amino acid transport system permease subunit
MMHECAQRLRQLVKLLEEVGEAYAGISLPSVEGDMLVLALDIVAGFGGMVSLCHGALMGLGAYAYALGAAKAVSALRRIL